MKNDYLKIREHINNSLGIVVIKICNMQIDYHEVRNILVDLLDLKKFPETVNLILKAYLEKLVDLKSRIEFLECAYEYEGFTEAEQESFSNEINPRYIEQEQLIDQIIEYVLSLTV